MAELSELRFFEDVLDWIVFDPERRAIFLAAGNKSRPATVGGLVPASGQRGGRQIHRLP
ncbi:hypothetical protein ACPB9I_20900 [Streptomyces cellulosae]